MEVQQSDESMEELNEPELTDPSEESVTERIKKSQEEWHWQKKQKQKNFALKEFLEVFHAIESTKYKILDADPSLERIWQFSRKQKRCSLWIISYTMRRWQALFKLLLIYILQSNKTF